MKLAVILQNLGMAGRWDLLAERLRPARADILLLNEAPASDALFAGLLGLAALPLPPSESGIPPVIFTSRRALVT